MKLVKIRNRNLFSGKVCLYYMVKDKDYIVAKKLFEKITLEELDDEKNFGLGLCLYGQKLYPEAKKCFNKILDKYKYKEVNNQGRKK